MKKIFNNFKIVKYIIEFSPIQLPVIFLSAILRSIQSIMGVLILKLIIDTITVSLNLKRLIIIIIFFFFLNITISSILTYIEQKINVKSQKKISKNMQLLLFKQSILLDLDCYENAEYYNQLAIAREQAEVRIIGILSSISSMVTAIFSICALITLISTMEPIIILLTFCNVIISYSVNMLSLKITHKFYNEQIPVERKMNYMQRISSQAEFAKELRMYSDFPKLIKNRFEDGLNTLLKLIDKYSGKYIKLVCIQNIIAQIINSINILFLAHQVLMGILSTGSFVALLNSIQNLTSQITIFAKVFQNLVEHGIYIESFLELLRYEPKIVNKVDGHKINENIDIEFKNVSYSYSNSKKYALKNISFKIGKGEKIAIVGQNGAGKSTLVKLITRLYDPNTGTIYLNGHPYQEYSLNEIRNCFGTLFQDFHIFSISVGENILMREVLTEDDYKTVNQSLKMVGMDIKVNELKNDIHTEVSREYDNEGVIFSGGEFQNIAVARAFSKKSRAIILDEPSSALDPISEKELFDKMLKIMEEKTVVLISHRLTNITNVDRIIYLENGEIKEIGTHFELLSKKGAYCEMYNAQKNRYI